MIDKDRNRSLFLHSGPNRWAGTAIVVLAAVCASQRMAQATVHGEINELLTRSDAWFSSAQGQKTIDNIVSWQNANGGWWKKYDPATARPNLLPAPSTQDAGPGDTEDVWRRTSTFDNGATYTEMRLIARAHRLRPQDKY